MISLHQSPTTAQTSAEARPTATECERRKQQILEALQGFDLTVEEFCTMLRVDKDEYAPRFTELRDDGQIFASGKRRMTSKGKMATVWTTSSRRYAWDDKKLDWVLIQGAAVQEKLL